jgi:hypothetical protein
MGTTKKRRNRAFGAAKAKKDAKAYIAPTCRFESVEGGKRRRKRKRTTRAMGMIIALLIPC